MFKNFLLITLRSMMKNKLFIFINVFGMAVAIACCIVAYFAYEFEATFDGNHTNGAHIYRVSAVREFDHQTDEIRICAAAIEGDCEPKFQRRR